MGRKSLTNGTYEEGLEGKKMGPYRTQVQEPEKQENGWFTRLGCRNAFCQLQLSDMAERV